MPAVISLFRLLVMRKKRENSQELGLGIVHFLFPCEEAIRDEETEGKQKKKGVKQSQRQDKSLYLGECKAGLSE